MEGVRALASYVVLFVCAAALGCLCEASRRLSLWAAANPRHPRSQLAARAATICAAIAAAGIIGGMVWFVVSTVRDQPSCNVIDDAGTTDCELYR